MEQKNDSKPVGRIRYANQNIQLPQLEHSMMALYRRRTSAEVISEAKTCVNDASPLMSITSPSQPASVGGVRVVGTRRPITPKEPGRVLYGKVTLPGRPPSAFSLRYLQNGDSRGSTPKIASLELLSNGEARESHSFTAKALSLTRNVGSREGDSSDKALSRRSQSFKSHFECYDNNHLLNATVNHSPQMQAKSQMVRKLPSLDIKRVSLNAKAENVSHNKERAKTAYNEISAMQNQSIHFTGSICNENCTVNLLTTRKILTRHNDPLGQSSTEKLIDMLREHAGLKECTEETASHINSILTELYKRVRKNEKQFKTGFILGGLYGLVEAASAKILLSVARVVLALGVCGSNLTGACKLIFKVARNEQNDHLFYDGDLLELLIDGLGRASPLEDPEACIYGYGSIRFLTCSTLKERAELAGGKDFNRNWSEKFELPRKPSTAPSLGESQDVVSSKRQKEFVEKLSKQDSLVFRLSRQGAVQLMILHLQMLNEAAATQKLSGPPLHSLYQLSAALRTLADVRQMSSSIDRLESSNKSFNATSIQFELACSHLIRAAEVTIGEIDVQANIVRTLSVLSEDTDCCHILKNYAGRIGLLLGPCITNCKNNQSDKLLSLISRLGYILGNIMAKYDHARIQFYHNDAAMEYLMNVLEIYSKEPLTLHNSLGDTVVDVLIKMVRVLANMSVNSEVGFGLGNTQSLGNTLMELLRTSLEIKSIKLKQELKELTHATLGALHNLCFYQENTGKTLGTVIESKGSIQSVLPELAAQLCSILKTNLEEITETEITRVLGNLTRNERARRSFCKSKGLKRVVEILIKSATSHSYDLKACTIGILVNLLGDMENRLPLIQLRGAEILLQLLRDALQNHSDFFLATIISQAFWNFFMDTPHLEDVCSESTLDELSDILAEYLDEETFFSNCNKNLVPEVWEEFAIVSTDLLERLQSNYDPLTDSVVSLETSDFENDDGNVYIDGMKSKAFFEKTDN